MADIPLAAPRSRSALRRAIPALGFTQMTGWGTTYYIPAILQPNFARDLGLSSPAIFAGVAVMLLAAALVAWPAGRLMDRLGAGRLMPLGSAFFALGLAVLGQAEGAVGYYLAWAFCGAGMALALSNAAFAALAQIAGQEARRAIVLLMLFGGMASTVFWPLTLWLEGHIGWRMTCFAFAGLHAAVCLPLHALFLAASTRPEARLDLASENLEGAIPPERRRLAAGLLMVIFGCGGFVSWGLDLHLIAILGEFGLGVAVAVSVAAIRGPATLLARALDIAAGPRLSPLNGALVAMALTPLAIAFALAFGQGIVAATAFIVLYAFGTGLATVARATLPLFLLGSRGYATTMGKLTLPTQAIYAVSPMLFGMLLEAMGTWGALGIALGAALVSFGATVILSRLTAQPA